jgi:hypothetical protein
VTELIRPSLDAFGVLALAECVERAAREVGSIRRRLALDPELRPEFEAVCYRVSRLADHIETAALILTLSAAELVDGDDAEAVEAAIRAVDRRAAEVQRLLGGAR